MKSSEIRERFLEFFRDRGHQVLPGSSLVPKDPTVLLTLAGMLQFKPIFLGQEKPADRRVTTVQKCIRMIDIDRVGKTPRHHTFFEMLGNFSFGDYFKKEAIEFAWELLTKEFKIPVNKLKIAVYEKDDEAFEVWNKVIGLPKEIIFRLGEDNNFWAAGPTGPCGPCSEIYYDLGPEHGCGKPECAPGCDCDRFLEIWNLVFIQFNRDEKGSLLPLRQKGIDTGMGLERIAAVLQGAADNFDTDLFVPLIKKIKALASNDNAASVKIIADHIRAVTHLISDGVFPGNTGRDYVLRRLIRRAVCHGRKLGIDRPFLSELSGEVVSLMRDAYPILSEKGNLIAGVINEEEKYFFATLEQGLKLFEELLQKHAKDKTLSGAETFKLHDTYGFPVDLTVELSSERGYKVDQSGFEKEMESQRERARQTRKGNLLTNQDLSHLKPTEFTGYEKTTEETRVIAILPEPKLVVLEKSPFYGESGGQAGDTGIIQSTRVLNTVVTPQGTILHAVESLDGLKEKQKVKAVIDASKRKATEIHHTATHLLHKALREILGDQVKQAGSYVGPDKLRFDFPAFHALSPEEIQKVEQLVNLKIKEQLKVEVFQKSYPEALKMGATALFGEKYGERVRVIKIDDYSLELCGGTHVKSTGELLFFKIISESALGSGVRRIEALAGQTAKVYVMYKAKSLYDEVKALIHRYRDLQLEKEKLGGEKFLETNIFEIEITELERLGKAVDSQDSTNVSKFLEHLCGRADWLKERLAKVEKEILHLQGEKAQTEAVNYPSEIKEIAGKKVLLKEIKEASMDSLRSIADFLQGKAPSCILLLASAFPDRLIYLVIVTQDLAAQGVSANKIAETFSSIVGGKGGGKETKVEGGGKYPSRIQEGFKAVESLLK